MSTDVKNNRRNRIRSTSKADIAFDVFNAIVMIVILLIVLYPLYFVLIASFSDPMAVRRGETFFWFKDIGFEGYEEILKTSSIWSGYGNTIFYTICGTVLSLALTLTAAFALSQKDLPFRKVINAFIVFTMLFDGGMIPRYMLIRNIKIYDTVWAMLLPRAVWVFCLMVARTFIEESIPHELYEAAQVEGCSFARYFVSVVLPLSSALVSILVLYYGIGQWNSYFDAMLYLQTKELYPLQLILRDILITNQSQNMMMLADSPELIDEMIRKSESMKYGIVIVSSLPVLVLYPFLQKYFVKGVMIGAIKG